MKPHAFIAMPFGLKPGPDGQPIDFDRIHRELLAPALEAAGCEPFRADEEMAAGDIRSDMFQELLVADLVLVDLTLDNPNVWYELGVRHALRARGVVLVQGPRPTNPFDIYTDRKLRYHLKDGAPDPAFKDADIAAMTAMVSETLATNTRRKVSPVYKLLPHLRQPEWRALLLEEANEFRDALTIWRERTETARRKSRPGAILQLATETPTRALRLEAQRDAGNALLKLAHYDFALEQFDSALGIEPDDQESRQKRVICLGRMGLFEEAQTAVESLTRDYPNDPESWALAGRVAKERWLRRWREDPPCEAGATPVARTPAQLREAAAEEDALLGAAIAPYRAAFTADARHYYSGINAVALMVIRQHLGGEVDEDELQLVTGGVCWACASAEAQDSGNYWVVSSAAELALLFEPLEVIRRRFKAAIAVANRDWFALDSTRQTLEVARDLGFRPEETANALALVEREIERSRPPVRPRKVILFSGHMMDAPGRDPPRFPPELENAAAQAIEAALERLEAGEDDLALCQAAAGGDLLFLEACQRRKMHIQIMLPFDEARFVDESVRPSANGEQWCMRYYAVQALLRTPPRALEDELGPLPRGASAYERCNQWLLCTALAWGVAKVNFICLWNGGGGDGPGGTAHMYNEVKRRTGRVTWIDTRTLKPTSPTPLEPTR
jgi:tetratricopeptide (TPR) repeat protein